MTEQKGILQLLEEDEEIQSLKKELHKLTGFWLGWHFEHHRGVEDYRSDLKRQVERAKENNG